MVEVLDESSSPCSPSGPILREDGFEYDVFLSFRGADTRKGFTGHLYEALKVRGVEAFIDSEMLEKGQKVEELFGYIERSKIFVPVFSKGHEAKLIGLIVKRILTEVNKASLFVTKHGVGLDSRIADVMKVLELEAHDDVRMVGVCAMGGMRKTTLVKAVYNKISSCFGGCCFISNVREAARQSSGFVSLQEQLLRSVCKETFYITSIDHGIGIIKTRIRRKMILLILDDVDHESQLNALAGGLDWFGSGSRIIVTTRDRGGVESTKSEAERNL